jgi:hypothetical protein
VPPTAGNADETQVFARVTSPPPDGPPGDPAGTTVFQAPTRGDATEQLPVVVVPPPPGSFVPGTGPMGDPPARSRRQRALLILGMALVALAAVGIAVVVGTRANDPETVDTGGIATNTPNAKHPPQRDASLERCAIDVAGVHVSGSVRNRTDDAADYVMDLVLVDDAGRPITSGTSRVDGVAPGATQPWEATLPPQPSTAPTATCKIVTVDRYRAGT